MRYLWLLLLVGCGGSGDPVVEPIIEPAVELAIDHQVWDESQWNEGMWQ